MKKPVGQSARSDLALRASEERLRLVMEATSDGIWDWQLATGELYFSDRWYTMLGYTPGEFPASYAAWRDRVHPDDLPAAEAAIAAHLDGHSSNFSIEFRMRTSSGDWKWINGRGKVSQRDAKQRALRVVGTHVDIHARKLAEEELQLSRFAIDRASVAIAWARADGRYLYANREMCRILGYHRDELLQMRVVDVDPRPDPETRWQAHWQTLRAAGSLTSESERRRKDGSTLPVELSASYFEYGGEAYSIAFVRDISERKRVEAELQKHRQNLETLVGERTAELRQAMRQLMRSEKLAALGQLVAGVAHELNTPLGNARVVAGVLAERVREFAHACESGPLRRSQLATFLDRCQEAARLLDQNTVRAAELISQFKQVAIDQASIRRRVFDLRQTVEDLLASLRPLFKGRQHRVELDIPAGLRLDSYPGPLEQVIVNLVSNSLLHGFDGVDRGLIRLAAGEIDGERIRLCYSDDGKGIADSVRDRIFDPFFTTRMDSGGSGLGLYISHNLVSSVLGGTLDVHGQPGQGARFDIVLPKVAPAATSPGTPPATDPAVGGQLPSELMNARSGMQE
ncbi:PAS domain S-box protein [Accumulibacter sp.]|uniref:PAS domain-containing sensor histidine kinase n=1 Tax=Accumulibacter sp. TaxID=2053492 RepID=UPI001ACD6FAD|nr:PAS domain S-box protein [Accumulibacter sp.]MBN8517181.1 PAS domain S-box protein [Accumulibacter sp.]MCM8579475.1 PAS domain S-box protein [Accumulibacter sp.]